MAARAKPTEAAFRRGIDRDLDRLRRARMADVRRLERAVARATGRPDELLRVRKELVAATLEVVRVDHLGREIAGIVRELELQIATAELAAQTRTQNALVRFHAAQGSRRARDTPPSDGAGYEQARDAVAIVMADRNRIRDQIALLEADPAGAADLARWRRELVTHEAHLAVLIEGLRALRARSD